MLAVVILTYIATWLQICFMCKVNTKALCGIFSQSHYFEYITIQYKTEYRYALKFNLLMEARS